MSEAMRIAASLYNDPRYFSKSEIRIRNNKRILPDWNNIAGIKFLFNLIDAQIKQAHTRVNPVHPAERHA